MKKWFGYNNLKPNKVNMHSTEKEPLSTKSPLNNYATVKKNILGFLYKISVKLYYLCFCI